MIQAQFLLLFAPERAWQELSEKSFRQQFLLPLLVYPMLLLAAFSVFVQYAYGNIDMQEAVKVSVMTFFKYLICIIAALAILRLMTKYYYESPCNQYDVHMFVGYAYTISFLAVIIGNLLPSRFSFIEFLPAYMIWVIYKGKDYLKIPSEHTFGFVTVASALCIGLPIVFDLAIGKIMN